MDRKERNLCLDLLILLCIGCAVFTMWSVGQDHTKKDSDNIALMVPVTERPEPALPRYCYLWSDDTKTAYYEDTQTGYVHKADDSGHIEKSPMTDADGTFLTYDMWRKDHPDWSY